MRVYDEFEDMEIDLTKKLQYHRCSLSCGSSAIFNFDNNPLSYVESNSKNRVYHHVINNTKVIYDDTPMIKLVEIKNYESIIDEIGLSENDKYVFVLRNGRDILRRDMYSNLKACFVGYWKLANNYNSAINHNVLEGTPAKYYYYELEAGKLFISSMEDGEYTVIDKVEQLDKLGYKEEELNTLIDELNGIATVKNLLKKGKKIYIVNCDISGKMDNIKRYFEDLIKVVDYYYDKPLPYMAYMICKEFKKDYTSIVDKEVVDGQYVYSIAKENKGKARRLLMDYCISSEIVIRPDDNKFKLIDNVFELVFAQ